jgi:hypothetical protein
MKTRFFDCDVESDGEVSNVRNTRWITATGGEFSVYLYACDMESSEDITIELTHRGARHLIQTLTDLMDSTEIEFIPQWEKVGDDED